tara:strand:- start:202 stop:339 length:138 start_codon:yes stop_codon:yes gene_type:complete
MTRKKALEIVLHLATTDAIDQKEFKCGEISEAIKIVEEMIIWMKE